MRVQLELTACPALLWIFLTFLGLLNGFKAVTMGSGVELTTVGCVL